MKFLIAALKTATVVAIISFGIQPSQAQQPTDGGAPAGEETGLSTEVDTTAFSGIERDETVGGTAASGFGLAAENEGAPRSGVGGIGGGGLGAFGGLGGFGALNNLFRGGFGGQGSSKPIIRTRVRSAVKVAPVAPAVVQREAASRLNRLTAMRERQLGGVNVQMFGRTAVLTGAVGSESDRRMSQLMLRLEPGVSKIENRVIVQP